MDANGRLLALAANGDLRRVDFQSGVATKLVTLPSTPASSAVLLGSTIVIGTTANAIHGVTETAITWTANLNHGDVTGLAASDPTVDAANLYATTANGTLIALKDSVVQWSRQLSFSALSFPNIAPAQVGRLPTLYLTTPNVIHGVIVDGPLSAFSSWPKTHRNARNNANLAD